MNQKLNSQFSPNSVPDFQKMGGKRNIRRGMRSRRLTASDLTEMGRKMKTQEMTPGF